MLLGADRIAMGGKKITAKSYVQDGLIAMWDGIENTGWGTHDASATTWKDLVGDVDIIGRNASGYAWDDDAVVISAVPRPMYANSYLSGVKCFECVVEYDESNSSNYGVAFGAELYAYSSYYDTFSPCIMFIKSTGILTFGYDIGGVYYANGCHAYSINDNGGSYFAYDTITEDGVEVSKTGRGDHYANSEGMTGVGINPRNAACFAGKIKSVRCYNRNLTAAEIAANYAVDKARFGLT